MEEGTGPTRRFTEQLRETNLVNDPISEGTDPGIRFLQNDKKVSPVSDPTEDGMDDANELPPKSRYDRDASV